MLVFKLLDKDFGGWHNLTATQSAVIGELRRKKKLQLARKMKFNLINKT